MRFAGSQRLDERRRRRLAVETDETDRLDVSASPGLAGDGSRRVDAVSPSATASAPGEGTPAEARLPVSVPISEFIPYALWKHILMCLGLAALGGGLLAGPSWSVQLSQWVGVSFMRWLTSPLLRAQYQAGVLMGSAGLAAALWKMRSRSLEDFDGRYRVWLKTAALLSLFALCVTTSLHIALAMTIRAHLGPWPPVPNRWLWLLPSIVVGSWMSVRLHREMRGCRVSLAAFEGAALMYLASAAWALVSAAQPPWPAVAAWEAGLTWGAHVLLWLSLSLHARHVGYHTIEPIKLARRTFRIPCPHFSWPSGLWTKRRRAGVDKAPASTSTPVPPNAADAASRGKSRRGKPVAKEDQPAGADGTAAPASTKAKSLPDRDKAPGTVRSPDTAAGPVPDGASSPVENSEPSPAGVFKKSRIRFDGRLTEASLGTAAADKTVTPSGANISSSDALGSPGVTSPAAASATAIDGRAANGQTATGGSAVGPEDGPHSASPSDAGFVDHGATSDGQNVDDDAESDVSDNDEGAGGEIGPESSGFNTQVDLRGLSKKQRRRLIQEQRDRERQARQRR